jgi:hypothetical protein
MRSHLLALARAVLACALWTAAAPANDVDGPNDCQRDLIDMGDAPELIVAYPGVAGHFPTCLAPSAPGSFNVIPLCPPRSTPPGPTGWVTHFEFNPVNNYWLGCGPAAAPPLGIDSEINGKVSLAAAVSVCDQTLPVECNLVCAGVSWGQ